MGEERKVYRVLVEKPEGETLRRRPRDKWENGISMNLVEIGWGVWSEFSRVSVGAGGGLL
jgi:hypothetical protein